MSDDRLLLLVEEVKRGLGSFPGGEGAPPTGAKRRRTEWPPQDWLTLLNTASTSQIKNTLSSKNDSTAAGLPPSHMTNHRILNHDLDTDDLSRAGVYQSRSMAPATTKGTVRTTSYGNSGLLAASTARGTGEPGSYVNVCGGNNQRCMGTVCTQSVDSGINNLCNNPRSILGNNNGRWNLVNKAERNIRFSDVGPQPLGSGRLHQTYKVTREPINSRDNEISYYDLLNEVNRLRDLFINQAHLNGTERNNGNYNSYQDLREHRDSLGHTDFLNQRNLDRQRFDGRNGVPVRPVGLPISKWRIQEFDGREEN